MFWSENVRWRTEDCYVGLIITLQCALAGTRFAGILQQAA